MGGGDTGRAMSRENVEIVRRLLDAFNRRDSAAWLEVADPDVENLPPRDWPESDPIRGPEAVWDFYVEAFEAWEEGAVLPAEFIDAGHDKVVTHVQGDLRGQASGADVTWSFWQVSTFCDGKLLRVEWFAERSDALEAVGLRE